MKTYCVSKVMYRAWYSKNIKAKNESEAIKKAIEANYWEENDNCEPGPEYTAVIV